MTFIIAEIGVNHNGDVDLAKKLIEEVAPYADAVKFQLSDPEELHSSSSILASYQKKSGIASSALSMSQMLNLSREEHLELKNYCNSMDVEYMCTGFDLESIKFLNEVVGINRFKIASGEILSLDVLNYMSEQNKPIIMSTGMASIDEIRFALDYLNRNNKQDITLLYCVSEYPTSIDKVNFSTLEQFTKIFKFPVGFSDHTIGTLASSTAVALNCSVIEKHITLDKFMNGPDHSASAEIEEFKELVLNIRNVESMKKIRPRIISSGEEATKTVARKSLVASRNLLAGEILTAEDISFKRPGTGLSPQYIDTVVGKKLKLDIDYNSLILPEHIHD